MILDRTWQPPVLPVDKEMVLPEQSVFPNGTGLYSLNLIDPDVSRIDIMIEAGKWEQSKNLIATFTNLLLKEGAGNLDSRTIAEELDFYGARLQLYTTHHYSYLTLYTTNRFFRETLDLVELMIKSPVFPEDKLQTTLNRRKQQFLIDREKVQWLAMNGFTSVLFGENHPYGTKETESDFDRLNVDDLKNFYRKYYNNRRTNIILSGKISDEMMRNVESRFGMEKWGSEEEITPSSYVVRSKPDHRVFIEKSGAMQNGIRMGLPTINRSHPEYHSLCILDTILGGYFGSRLMSNIREDKGYTYGISSAITTLKHEAYLTISSQTACEFTDLLIQEVYHEIDRLHQDLVDADELEMVKNYMLGDLVRNLDDVFALADFNISLLAGGLPFDFFEKKKAAIHRITADEIRDLAQKYLKKDQMYCVVAGQK